MTAVARLAPANVYISVKPVRAVAETFTVTARSVRRLTPHPPLRPPAPPHGPSYLDVMRAWEEMDAWSCAYCDASFGRMVVCQIDHVIPLADGGPHEMWNLAPACESCNRGKSDRPAEAWLAFLASEAPTERR